MYLRLWNVPPNRRGYRLPDVLSLPAIYPVGIANDHLAGTLILQDGLNGHAPVNARPETSVRAREKSSRPTPLKYLYQRGLPVSADGAI